MPRGQHPLCVKAGFRMNVAGWPKVCPREFLLTCPTERHRFLRGFGDPRGLNCSLGRMFAAEAGAKIRNNDLRVFVGNVKHARKLTAVTKRILSSSPPRDFPICPFVYPSTRLD